MAVWAQIPITPIGDSAAAVEVHPEQRDRKVAPTGTVEHARDDPPLAERADVGALGVLVAATSPPM